MSARSIALDCLNQCKSLAVSHIKSSTECSHPELRRTFMDMARQDMEMGEELFHIANRKGWYQTIPANQNTISHVSSMASQAQGFAGRPPFVGPEHVGAGTPGWAPTGFAGPTYPVGGGRSPYHYEVGQEFERNDRNRENR